MKKIKLTYSIIILLITIMYWGCSNFLTNPNSNNKDNQNKIHITINKPVSNDSIGYGFTNIDYTLTQDKGINFIEVYVEGSLNSSNQPTSNGGKPKISLYVDSSNVGRRLFFYMIYYDKNGAATRSDTVKNLLITEPPPYTPYDVNLLKLNSTTVNVSWKDSAKNVYNYEVWRQLGSSGTFKLLYTVDNKTFNVNDPNLNTDSVYFYKIRAKNQFGYSDFSEIVKRTGNNGSSFPPPVNVKANAVGMTQVNVTWTENYPSVNYFRVERRLANDTTFKTVGIAQNDARSYSDSANGLTPGGSYNYRVIAYSNTDSAVSNQAYVKLPTFQMRAPTLHSPTYQGSGKVVLNWRDNDAHYANFEIERKDGANGTFKYIGEAAGYLSTYTDSVNANGTTYYYRMRETDVGYYSLYSNVVSITVQ